MGRGILVYNFSRTMFLNGFMHILELSQIVAVDIEGVAVAWMDLCFVM
jgi:hypothetical protein